MSKAFVNEDANPPTLDLQHRELVDPSQNYMTPQGLENLKCERDQLPVDDSRFAHLDRLIKTAKVIVPENQVSDRVLFGATVRLRGESLGERIYKIVGANETDANSGKISFLSPVGKILMQTRVGDVVTLKSPSGQEEEIEILSIQYLPIS